MVRDYIHYDFQALVMRLLHELPVQVICPEPRVDMIIVGTGIAMV